MPRRGSARRWNMRAQLWKIKPGGRTCAVQLERTRNGGGYYSTSMRIADHTHLAASAPSARDSACADRPPRPGRGRRAEPAAIGLECQQDRVFVDLGHRDLGAIAVEGEHFHGAAAMPGIRRAGRLEHVAQQGAPETNGPRPGVVMRRQLIMPSFCSMARSKLAAFPKLALPTLKKASSNSSSAPRLLVATWPCTVSTTGPVGPARSAAARRARRRDRRRERAGLSSGDASFPPFHPRRLPYHASRKGKTMVAVVPSPSALSISSRPPCSPIRRREMVMPSPVPWPRWFFGPA